MTDRISNRSKEIKGDMEFPEGFTTSDVRSAKVTGEKEDVMTQLLDIEFTFGAVC